MENKYLNMLDAETLAFVQQTEAFYPADAVEASIEQQREFYDALCNEFQTDYPDAVSSSDDIISTEGAAIPVRRYQKSDAMSAAQIVFFHGGGFVVGGLESHDSICAEFCDRTGMDLVAVDYCLAPEHIHPAAFNDCLHAYRSIVRASDRPTILVGDSAGGTLAAAVAHSVKHDPEAAVGQLLIYPALGGDLQKGSYITHANAPMLTLADVAFYTEIRGGGTNLSKDPTASPLAASEFENLPPTVIVTAECDPLADDGSDYMNALTSAGCKAHWRNETGMVHGYLRARGGVERARDSVSFMVRCLNMLANGNWDFQ